MVKTHFLEERYPNLAFLLRFHQFSPPPFPYHSADIKQEIKQAVKQLQLDQVQAIYIYGLGLGFYYFPFKEWLAENRERDLIFIEEDLAALHAFLEMEHAAEILNHPQVHLRFNLDKKQLKKFVGECAASFPYESIGVIALASYKLYYRSRFYRLRLALERFTTVLYGVFLENYYYNYFCRNLFPNFRRLERAFDGSALLFQDIPAIICGAGPSLAGDIETLRKLNNQALIIAGGSAITALTNHGIHPHLGIAFDPNMEEVRRIKDSQAFELPLFYASRLHPDVFYLCNGPHGYLHTETGGRAELWLEDKLALKLKPLKPGFTEEALSVTTAAIQLMATLGCTPIILVGVDLAFTGNQAYSTGVVIASTTHPTLQIQENRTAEKLLKRKDIHGKSVYTLVKWVMESAAIDGFAKRNPEIELINATAGGLGFKSIPNRSLKSIPFPSPQDLSARVHQAIQTHPLHIPTGAVEFHLETLKSSLEQGKVYVEIALEELKESYGKNQDPETGRLIFAQMELETLDAYSCFLQDTSYTFSTLIARKYRGTTWGKVDYELKWSYLYSKWSAYQTLIDDFLSLY